MVIRFCPRCKGILFLVGDKAICRNCDYVLPMKLELSTNEKIPEQKEVGEGVVSDKNTFATYEHKCKKCGHDKAQVIDCGVLISDEDNLIMIKCGKCSFTERVGKKVS